MKFYTFVCLIAAVSAIRLADDKDKNKAGPANQSRGTLDAGVKVADKVVATQEATQANYNAMHAAAMDKAHKDQFNHKVSVWGPADLVSSQNANAKSRGNH